MALGAGLKVSFQSLTGIYGRRDVEVTQLSVTIVLASCVVVSAFCRRRPPSAEPRQ